MKVCRPFCIYKQSYNWWKRSWIRRHQAVEALCFWPQLFPSHQSLCPQRTGLRRVYPKHSQFAQLWIDAFRSFGTCHCWMRTLCCHWKTKSAREHGLFWRGLFEKCIFASSQNQRETGFWLVIANDHMQRGVYKCFCASGLFGRARVQMRFTVCTSMYVDIKYRLMRAGVH